MIGLYLTGHPLDAYAVEMELCTKCLADLPDAKSASELMNLLGQTFTVGGLISKVRTGTSQNNNPYKIFTLEDYSGNYEFPLFGKQYQQHANEVVENLFVVMEVAVQDRFAEYKYRKADAEPRPEMVVKRIELLSEMAKIRKNLTLKLPVEEIDEDLIAYLESCMEAPEGEQRDPSELHVSVVDDASHNVVNLVSRRPIFLTLPLVQFLKRKREDSVLNYRVYK